MYSFVKRNTSAAFFCGRKQRKWCEGKEKESFINERLYLKIVKSSEKILTKIRTYVKV